MHRTQCLYSLSPHQKLAFLGITHQDWLLFLLCTPDCVDLEAECPEQYACLLLPGLSDLKMEPVEAVDYYLGHGEPSVFVHREL